MSLYLFIGSWTPSKEMLEVVEAAILHKQSDIYAELDEVLTKYKLLFLNLLKNEVRHYWIFFSFHSKLER